MNHAYYVDAMNKSNRRIMKWYQNNLMPVLQAQKERHVREVDVSIALADTLMQKLNEPVSKPIVVPSHELVPAKDDSLMKPIEPEVEHLLYGSTEKGAAERYLKVRNKKSPEDKYFFRVVTSWDYGWKQSESHQRAREVQKGRCAILRDTFYRKNNIAPDPRHYGVPTGGQVSICSEYSCSFT